MKIFPAIIVCLSLSTGSAHADTAVLSPGAGLLGGYMALKGVKSVGKACIDHPIICGIAGTAAVVGGGAAIAKATKARKKHEADDQCTSGYRDMFRLVSRYELADIQITNVYRNGINSISEKEFWGRFEDALWYAEKTKNFPEASKGYYIMTSLACLETLRLAHTFSDGEQGRIVFAFDDVGLKLMNIDAHNTKGIRLVKKIKW